MHWNILHLERLAKHVRGNSSGRPKYSQAATPGKYLSIRLRIATARSHAKLSCFKSAQLTLLLATSAAAAKSEFTLVRERVPAATIVIADHPSQSAVASAIELQDHVYKISRARLPIVSDTVNVTGPRILIGESRATRSHGLSNRTFASQEYTVDVRERDVILMGRDADKPYGLRVNGSPKSITGRFGRALLFDGKADSIAVTARTGFDDNHGSLEAWVQVVKDSRGDILRLDGAPSSYHIVGYFEGTLHYMTFDGKLGVPPVVSGKLTLGWHHFLATWDARAGKKQLYVDGKSVGIAPYSATHCANAQLGVGAIVEYNPSNYFKGAIDEVRLSKQVLTPDMTHAPTDSAAQSSVVLHFDERGTAPNLTTVVDRLAMGPTLLPDLYDEQGTAYAAHHFLERLLGIRWYGPTDLGAVIPQRSTLVLSPTRIRRKPSFAWRNIMPISAWGDLMPTVAGLWDHPSKEQMQVYAFRMRNGGEQFVCTHGFYGFYDRFWEKNPKNEAAWEGHHADWFVHGQPGKPTEMCFSNSGFVRQVVSDARDFFDGKGTKYGGRAAGNFFSIGPLDDDRFCDCTGCDQDLPAYANNQHFSNGKYSNYIFQFANRVARGLQRTHADKYVSILAYASWAKYPERLQLEPNIAVQLCLGTNNYWVPASERNELGIYREWVTKAKGNPIYLWLYPEFPEAIALWRGFTAFPGFNAQGIAQQMKMYYRDGIRGMFPEGITTQLNEYIYNQLAFDATQDVDLMINEFFTLYYGAASEPMRRLWTEIEDTFRTPSNYPIEVQTEDKDFHQTEEMAWKYLGNSERMARWEKYLAAAKEQAQSPEERARVALFEQGQWQPIVNAKRKYDNKTQYQSLVNRERLQPPLTSVIRKLPANIAGVLSGVDWRIGTPLRLTRDAQGYPIDRDITVTVLHDDKYLYMQLREAGNTSSLARTDAIFNSDDWEIFLAAQRDKPYRQIGINALGRYETIAYGESSNWRGRLTVTSDVLPSIWTVRLCIPLEEVVPNGIRTGQILYLNVIRGSTGGKPSPALSANYSNSFHDPTRLAKFNVE